MVGMACSSSIVMHLPGEEDSTAARTAARPLLTTRAGLAAGARASRPAGYADHDRVALLEAGGDLGVGAVGQTGRDPHRDELAVLDGDDDVAVAGAARTAGVAARAVGGGVAAGRAGRRFGARLGPVGALAVLGPLAALTALALRPLALALTGHGLAAGAALNALACARAADQSLLEGGLGEGERLVGHDEDVVALVGGDGDLGGHPRVEGGALDRLDRAGHRVVDHVVGRGAGRLDLQHLPREGLAGEGADREAHRVAHRHLAD